VAKHYNRKHKPITFAKGNKVYLRLSNGYKLKGIPKSKLSDQRTGPFLVLDKVGNLAYRLQLPSTWKIHPIISVAQLEPAKTDPFEREIAPTSPVVIAGEDEYEIETIIKAAMRERGKKQHYLVRWKGYGPEYDEWISAENLDHAKDLVEEFKLREKEKMNVIVH
jgi:hypothetical protein